MSTKRCQSGAEQFLRQQLHDPLRLRFVLCAFLLLGWYFGHHSPTTDYIKVTSSRTAAEKRRVATAQQIEQLRKAFAPYHDRIPAKEGPNEMIQYVMGHVRQTRLKLVDLIPSRNETFGTLRGIELQLLLEGSYTDLDDFLKWVENDHRLLRVDSLKVQRKQDRQSWLSMQLYLTGLVDATTPPTTPKGDAAEKAKSKIASR